VTAAAPLVPIFGIPMLAGLLPLSARLAGWTRRRLRRR
jgi:hypothetical protein